MRFNTMRIPCVHIGEAENFYSGLLGSNKAFGSEADGYVGFDIENVTILLEPVEADEFESGRYLGFSLEVEDIEAFYERMQQQGVSFTGPPERQFWGGIMTHVKDCSGNVFSIVQTDNA